MKKIKLDFNNKISEFNIIDKCLYCENDVKIISAEFLTSFICTSCHFNGYIDYNGLGYFIVDDLFINFHENKTSIYYDDCVYDSSKSSKLIKCYDNYMVLSIKELEDLRANCVFL